MFNRCFWLFCLILLPQLSPTAKIAYAESIVDQSKIRDFLELTLWPVDFSNPGKRHYLEAFRDDFTIYVTGETELAQKAYEQIVETLDYLKNRDALGHSIVAKLVHPKRQMKSGKLLGFEAKISYQKSLKQKDNQKNNGLTLIVLPAHPDAEAVQRYEEFIDGHFVSDGGNQTESQKKELVEEILTKDNYLFFRSYRKARTGRISALVVFTMENDVGIKTFSNYAFYLAIGLFLFNADIGHFDTFASPDHTKLISLDPDLTPTAFDVAVIKLITSHKARHLPRNVDFINTMLPGN